MKKYQEKYGTDHYFQSEEFKNKLKQYNIDNYGVEFYTQTDEFKIKTINTNMIRYGVPWSLQSPEIKAKIIKTNLERYNCMYALQNAIIRKKAKEKIMSIYGVDNVSKSQFIQQKKIITSRARYNCDYPMQDPEIKCISKTNSYFNKVYKFQSGKTILVQGYENYALDYLLKNLDYNELDILTSELDMPECWYYIETKYRRYFPDIYIPKDNLVIEVKSTYTYKLEKNEVITKCKSIKYNGYNMWLMIFGKKGELFELIKFK